MNRELIMQKTAKYYGLPIPNIPELYDYFLDLYEPLMGSKTIVKNLIKEIGDQDEDIYFENIIQTRKAIIEAVQATEGYKRFDAPDNPDFVEEKGKRTPVYSKRSDKYRFTKRSDVYSNSNHKKYFISVDMEKAGFQMLKKYSEDMVFFTDTYDEFVGKISDSEYLAKSRYIRQNMLGRLSPRRQNSMERYYTGLMLDALIEGGYMDIDDICVYTHDELVFSAEGYLPSEKLCEIKDFLYDRFGIRMHVESYMLRQFCGSSYAKEFEDGSFKLKCVPAHLYAQVYKKYIGLPITKQDLAFATENGVEYFTETIDGKKL